MNTTDRNELKSVIRGTVHFPDSDGYDTARQVWNGMIDRRPAAMVGVAGFADVIAAVTTSQENAIGEGGMVIDLAS